MVGTFILFRLLPCATGLRQSAKRRYLPLSGTLHAALGDARGGFHLVRQSAQEAALLLGFDQGRSEFARWRVWIVASLKPKLFCGVALWSKRPLSLVRV